MTLVLIADSDKANAIDQLNIDNCFDNLDNIIINDDSKYLAKLFPFIYTIENWRDSNLDAFTMIPMPSVKSVEEDVKAQGIQITDKECLDYQRLKPHEIMSMYKDTEFYTILDKWYNYLVTWHDIQENEASSFLLAAIINPCEPMIYLICKKYNVEKYDVANRIKIFKYVHTVIRLTGCNPLGGYLEHYQYLNLQYLQDLCNRRVYIHVNDKDELMADLGLRVLSPPGFRWLYMNDNNEICGDSERFEVELRRSLSNIFENICDNIKRSELIPFDVAWKTRANSMPSGAATGFKYKDQQIDKRAAHELNLINKDVIFEQSPMIYASASMKYENGKCRYLYSTDVYDQMRTDYILNLVDKHIHAVKESGMGLSQSQELQQEIDLLLAAQEREKCFSFDYEDYNNQHTFQYMQAFWECLYQKMNAKFEHLAKDYLNMIIIKLKSIENRFVGKLGTNGIIAKTIATLLSGSRETQTLNTINNVAYSMVIRKNIEELTGTDINTLLKALGDDQTGKDKTQKQAILHVLFMIVAGCEGNKHKILLGIEFLRKMYWRDGSINGYLNRSIANLVSRDQNRTERVDKQNIPISLITQLRKVYSRNGNKKALHIFYTRIIENKCQFVKDDKVIQIPFEYIYARKQLGGLGVYPLIGEFNTYNIVKQNKMPKLQISNVDQVESGMSKDLVDYIHEQFGVEIEDRNMVLQSMRQKNLINVASANDKKTWYENINTYYTNLKYINSSYTPTIYYNSIGKKIYEELLKYFLGDLKIKQYYNPIDVINSIVAKTEIKNFDVFNSLIRSVKQEKKMNEVQAIQLVLSRYLRDSNLIQIISQAVSRCGLDIVIKILSDEIQYNSILEGYVRDTVLVFIRSYVINFYITDNDLYKYIDKDVNKLIEMMESVELYILKDGSKGGIWKYIRP